MPFQTPVFREELSTLQGNDALKPIELLFEPRQTLNNGWRERRIQSLAYNFGDKKKSKKHLTFRKCLAKTPIWNVIQFQGQMGSVSRAGKGEKQD